MLIEMLRCRKAMKEFGCRTWFEYRGHPAGDAYDRNPAELWDFLYRADVVAGAILKESAPTRD